MEDAFDRLASTSKTLHLPHLDTWNTLIFDYSRCKLTKVTDKLVALNGVAKIMSVSGGSYYGGIWSEWNIRMAPIVK